MDSPGLDTPGAAELSHTRLVSATLLRNTHGKFDIVFKHNSGSNAIHVSEVETSDVPDDRGELRPFDRVQRVNGRRVVGLGLAEVQEIVAQSGGSLNLLLERQGSFVDMSEEDPADGALELPLPSDVPLLPSSYKRRPDMEQVSMKFLFCRGPKYDSAWNAC